MKENTDFIRHFAPLQQQLLMYIRSLLPNLSDADDLLQEVAATAWNKFESFDNSKGEFKSWLFGIARNKVMHSKRRFLRAQNLLNEVQMQKAEEHFSTRKVNDLDERQNALQSCIEKLSHDQKQLLIARYHEKKKSYELGAILNRSAEQIRIQLFRLRKVLKSCVMENVEQ
ncbi:sigma-70 family RNA polymerase sigma factor [Lentisphaera profundi]|uniref:Sigma-70 family RNA polymerase sigma factor n=1 Tax=Lentisphaera profundi TaxID=1658616 RepID=A0ABY7VN85_9BACT|nr:sigma-70 family RNA polymerase sigma factor [Lentisphaera profundi]WDE95342.1 sigma-70 family RNA polymerase sigma factor [Lentisphaera profundi]